VEFRGGADRTVSELSLSLDTISKRFGTTVALDGASIAVRGGTLHALLGENGAGKTTLMRLAFGIVHPDSGVISVNGTARRWRSSADAIAAGIGMVHQHFLLVPAMTVAENVALGDRGLFTRFAPREATERVRQIGAETGLVLDPAALASDLPVSAQQRLEIVKALARDARLLILDEPTAVLSPHEADALYSWLRRFVGGGGTVVLITHKVREALALADDVTVLRRGRSVLHAGTAGLDEPAIVEAMIGTRLDSAAAQPRTTVGSVVIHLEGVDAVDGLGMRRLRAASLEVAAGEIVAVAGVEGSGQRELLRVLAGRLRPATGRVVIPDRVGFVPEDRQRDALIPEMSLTENVALKDAGARTGVLDWTALGRHTGDLIQAHDIRSAGEFAAVATLSGGNQQKLVLARELDGEPQALIAENPTRGLDVRAAAQVAQLLRDARARGMAIVVYSSDLDEILALADRMIVCFEGRLIPVPADGDVVARAMIGAL
jgi:simple sugar transport system ATP-binding protein